MQKLWHPFRMKSLLAATVLLISLVGLLPSVQAQQAADEKYIAIYGVVQQAENLAENGDPKQALDSLTDAQTQLQQFQKTYPEWNPEIVNYRLDDLAKKIAAMNAKLGANPPAAQPAPAAPAAPAVPAVPAAAPAAAPVAPTEISPREQSLRSQLDAVLTENQTLQAKLKEALSAQPAKIDTGELVQAQSQNRSLLKENALLKANAMVERNTNGAIALRRQLADLLEKYNAEQARSQKLVDENAALQRDVKHTGIPDQGSLDQLRRENEHLKSQLASLQAAAGKVTAGGQLAEELQAADLRINSLQSNVTVVTLEKGALEKEVKQLSAEVAQAKSANLEGRLRDLTEQREELTKELAAANKKGSRKAEAPPASPTNELETLRARLAVAEAKPVPYTAEELAFFSQTPPQPGTDQHSIHELPPGAAELVASARHHFANHEFDAAEADYRKILALDPKNPLALANLATIELQENKFAEADKHITAALAVSPNDAYNLSTLGFLRFRQEKYDESLDALSRAAQLEPNNPEIQNYLGVTLSHKGQRTQAEAALRRAIELDPLYAQAHNNLAVVYLNQTPPMPLLARWHYQKAVAAGQPRNPDLEKLLADKGAPVDVK